VWEGVSSVFKGCDFGECTGREIYPKALTLPVDNLLLEIELVAVNKTNALSCPLISNSH